MEKKTELTKDLDSCITRLQNNMSAMNKEYDVKSIAIFGSYLHDNQDEESDLDLLVEFEESPTLFQFIRLENYLSDLLGMDVDLVMKDALKPGIAKRVKEEARKI